MKLWSLFFLNSTANEVHGHHMLHTDHFANECHSQREQLGDPFQDLSGLAIVTLVSLSVACRQHGYPTKDGVCECDLGVAPPAVFESQAGVLEVLVSKIMEDKVTWCLAFRGDPFIMTDWPSEPEAWPSWSIWLPASVAARAVWASGEDPFGPGHP